MNIGEYGYNKNGYNTIWHSAYPGISGYGHKSEVQVWPSLITDTSSVSKSALLFICVVNLGKGVVYQGATQL
jgi:hypothetical protein